MRDETAVLDEESLDRGSGEEQTDRPQISAPLSSTWSSPVLVQEERDAPGTSREILLDCTSSSPSSPPIILILLLPVVRVLGNPTSLHGTPMVPRMLVVTVMLECVNVALC